MTIGFKQPVAATDGLHTGAYGKTLTFTLSTTPTRTNEEKIDGSRSVLAALAAVLACLVWSSAAQAQQPGAGDFQKVTLDDNTQNPMELDIAPDGRVFYIERDGRLMIWKPDSQQTVTAGTVPVTRSQENGLLGLSSRPTSRSASGSTSSTRSCRTTRTRRSSRASRSTATRSTCPPSRRC